MRHIGSDGPRYLATIDPNTQCSIRSQSKNDPPFGFYAPQANVEIAWLDDDFSRICVPHGNVARTGPLGLISDRVLGRDCLGF